MQELQNLVVAMFSANSIWSVVARAAIWFVVAGVIIASTDNPNPDEGHKKLRTNLGFFVLFLVLSAGLMFLLFSYAPGATRAMQ